MRFAAILDLFRGLSRPIDSGAASETPASAGPTRVPQVEVVEDAVSDPVQTARAAPEAPADHPLSGHLIVSYGLPKSASTFAWLLLKDALKAGGAPVATLSTEAKGAPSREDYIERLTPERLTAIRREVGQGCVVVKTHNFAPPAGSIEEAGFAGLTIFVQHRDPRDIALSLIDHGNRSRELGISDFTQCEDVPRSLWTIEHALKAMSSWMAYEGAIPISYEDLCFETEATVEKFARALGLAVDPAGLVSAYADRSKITQFNKGQKDRWREEMSPEDAALVRTRFQGYYERFG